MPKFFIDTHDGDTLTTDRQGEVFDTTEEARTAAIAHLPGIADGRLPDGEHRTFQAIVRSEAGAAIYVATLAFHGEWQQEVSS